MTDIDALLKSVHLYGQASLVREYDRTPANVLADYLVDRSYLAEDYTYFLALVLADPDEDKWRLLAADWFEMNGQEERAEFVRIQCELAKFEAEREASGKSGWRTLKIRTRVEKLRDRAHKLLNPRYVDYIGHRYGDGQSKKWFDMPLFLRATNATCGFISHVTCSWAAWRQHAEKLVYWGPRVCGKCKGEGRTYYHDSVGELGDEKCPACRGTGELPGATVEVRETCTVNRDPKQDIFDEPGNPFQWRRHANCPECHGEETVVRHIPAPLLPSMQPITEVTLTTWPGVPGSLDGYEWIRERWPTIRTWYSLTGDEDSTCA